MNKIAETLVNPVASNLAPSGKSSNTAREGISPHTVVEDNIVVCLNREKLHQNQEKPFAMSCSFPTQESWRCVGTLWLQSCIREEGNQYERAGLFSLQGQYYPHCLPIHQFQRLLAREGAGSGLGLPVPCICKATQGCLTGSPSVFAYCCWTKEFRGHSGSKNMPN